jgi:hypothetical protein
MVLLRNVTNDEFNKVCSFHKLTALIAIQAPHTNPWGETALHASAGQKQGPGRPMNPGAFRAFRFPVALRRRLTRFGACEKNHLASLGHW